MKQRHVISLVKTLSLVVALPALSGCSFLVWTFMRNTSESAVLVKISWKYPNQKLPDFLSYLPKLLTPKPENMKLLCDSLPTTNTATTTTFRLPPHATVLVGDGYNQFQSFQSLRLQRVDSSVQLLDSTQLVNALKSKMIGGARLWYDIEAKNN
jgi:hypothetical protein